MSDDKKILDNDEVKSAIQKAVEEATKGLKEKVDEFKAEKLKIKKERDDAVAALEAAEADKAAAAEEAASKSGDVDKIKQQLEAKHRKEIEALTRGKTEAETMLNQVLIDNGITDALIKAKVAPQFMDAAKALIKQNSKAAVSIVDGKPTALIDEKPIGDFIAEWSQGDAGKNFVAAPENGGGGSGGPSGGGRVPVGVKRSEMNPLQKAKYIRENGEDKYNQLPE